MLKPDPQSKTPLPYPGSTVKLNNGKRRILASPESMSSPTIAIDIAIAIASILRTPSGIPYARIGFSLASKRNGRPCLRVYMALSKYI
jgi:hypothetical protein